MWLKDSEKHSQWTFALGRSTHYFHDRGFIFPAWRKNLTWTDYRTTSDLLDPVESIEGSKGTSVWSVWYSVFERPSTNNRSTMKKLIFVSGCLSACAGTFVSQTSNVEHHHYDNWANCVTNPVFGFSQGQEDRRYFWLIVTWCDSLDSALPNISATTNVSTLVCLSLFCNRCCTAWTGSM